MVSKKNLEERDTYGKHDPVEGLFAVVPKTDVTCTNGLSKFYEMRARSSCPESTAYKPPKISQIPPPKGVNLHIAT